MFKGQRSRLMSACNQNRWGDSDLQLDIMDLRVRIWPGLRQGL